jgi:hypothetical protein
MINITLPVTEKKDTPSAPQAVISDYRAQKSHQRKKFLANLGDATKDMTGDERLSYWTAIYTSTRSQSHLSRIALAQIRAGLDKSLEEKNTSGKKPFTRFYQTLLSDPIPGYKLIPLAASAINSLAANPDKAASAYDSFALAAHGAAYALINRTDNNKSQKKRVSRQIQKVIDLAEKHSALFGSDEKQTMLAVTNISNDAHSKGLQVHVDSARFLDVYIAEVAQNSSVAFQMTEQHVRNVIGKEKKKNTQAYLNQFEERLSTELKENGHTSVIRSNKTELERPATPEETIRSTFASNVISILHAQRDIPAEEPQNDIPSAEPQKPKNRWLALVSEKLSYWSQRKGSSAHHTDQSKEKFTRLPTEKTLQLLSSTMQTAGLSLVMTANANNLNNAKKSVQALNNLQDITHGLPRREKNTWVTQVLDEISNRAGEMKNIVRHNLAKQHDQEAIKKVFTEAKGEIYHPPATERNRENNPLSRFFAKTL